MTREEYERRCAENQKVTGFGIDGVQVHMPCPFCGAADFTVYKVVEAFAALKDPAVCKECGRGCKTIISGGNPITGLSDSLSIEFVQTCGDDPPDFLPKMRREPA